jgi:hypothetical protein
MGALRRATIILVLVAAATFLVLWALTTPEPSCPDGHSAVLGTNGWYCVVAQKIGEG